MKPLIALLATLAITACRDDETVGAYGGAGQEWYLVEIDGHRFDAKATVTFPEPGKIAGHAPCNSYSGAMTAPYPWFETGPLVVTKMACEYLDSESRFFAALGDMSLSEVSGKAMILSNDKGREMLFAAGD